MSLLPKYFEIILLKNNQQYGISYFKFSIKCKRERCSYHCVSFYDRETVLREKQDFHNKLDFYSHPPQRQQPYLIHLCRFNHLEDDRAGIFRYVF